MLVKDDILLQMMKASTKCSKKKYNQDFSQMQFNFIDPIKISVFSKSTFNIIFLFHVNKRVIEKKLIVL